MVVNQNRLEVNNLLFSKLNPLSAKWLAGMQVVRTNQPGKR